VRFEDWPDDGEPAAAVANAEPGFNGK
jgi:hypothetical protein